MRDNIAKKIFKDEILGRGLTARLLSEILHEDYKTIYENEKKKVYEDDKFMEKIITNAEEIAGRENTSLYLSNDEITKLDQEYHQRTCRKAEIKEMIVNFYNNDASLELISKSTNLTVDEVQDILTKHNKKNKSK